MGYLAGEYDVAVIGAGHAGCEAALASSRMGAKTIVFAINLDSIGNMPCNPSIGGPAKGQIVREIDALGGEMGKAADKNLIQSRMLNTSNGPAVRALRAQIDRRAYQSYMKKVMEDQENLDIKQGEIVEILVDENSKVCGVKTHIGAIYNVKSVVLATGVYLKGRVIIGENSYSSGPDGLFPANELSNCLEKLGIKLARFKTGTPARVNRKDIDFSKMEIQNGDEIITPFSAETEKIVRDQEPCWLTYTTENTHKVIRDNLHRSPLYSGNIKGIGPRYCPSLEDKIVRFADKERHQLFIEPMGDNTEEMYVQGASSSLPEEVQIEFLRTIPGLENVKIMRTAYAIEYDCIDPLQLNSGLEIKFIPGLFCAGQINGTSGYEEAAGQGLIAGINACQYVNNREYLVLGRHEAYIGVLIDDLITKGTNEPYRMMTSRAEYRLVLRQDNVEERLLKKGYDLGLISKERYERFLNQIKNIENEINRLKNTIISPSKRVNDFLNDKGTNILKTGITLDDLLKRSEISYDDIQFLEDKNLSEEILDRYEKEEVEIKVKYEGYIKRQEQQIEKFMNLEKIKLDNDIDYENIKGLRLEARQKLCKVKPCSLGQASRISGVSPADISVLLIFLEQKKG